MFPANTMEAWVTDAGQNLVSLEFRFHASMTGCLGLGVNLAHWGEDQIQEASRWIQFYKLIRPIIQLGNQYRLQSAQNSSFSAVEYMAKDQTEGVLFAFQTHSPEPIKKSRIYLHGLDTESIYTVEGEGEPKSGRAWMDSGLQIQLGNFQSAVKRILKV